MTTKIPQNALELLQLEIKCNSLNEEIAMLKSQLSDLRQNKYLIEHRLIQLSRELSKGSQQIEEKAQQLKGQYL